MIFFSSVTLPAYGCDKNNRGSLSQSYLKFVVSGQALADSRKDFLGYRRGELGSFVARNAEPTAIPPPSRVPDDGMSARKLYRAKSPPNSIFLFQTLRFPNPLQGRCKLAQILFGFLLLSQLPSPTP